MTLVGVTIDSAINTNPKDLASRDAIDRNAPNPKVCAKFGSSAMVLDQRVFITFNPFNVYVTQGKCCSAFLLRQFSNSFLFCNTLISEMSENEYILKTRCFFVPMLLPNLCSLELNRHREYLLYFVARL